uniref:Uncharacterized protein n=1 Tax=Sphaerodactylus townsendi TaxID=933632 RepID=A0ACB8FS20_9SAUR
MLNAGRPENGCPFSPHMPLPQREFCAFQQLHTANFAEAFPSVDMQSCLNPILYLLMGHGFKERFKHFILSVFENAFAKDVSQSTTQTKTRTSVKMDSGTYAAF